MTAASSQRRRGASATGIGAPPTATTQGNSPTGSSSPRDQQLGRPCHRPPKHHQTTRVRASLLAQWVQQGVSPPQQEAAGRHTDGEQQHQHHNHHQRHVLKGSPQGQRTQAATSRAPIRRSGPTAQPQPIRTGSGHDGPRARACAAAHPPLGTPIPPTGALLEPMEITPVRHGARPVRQQGPLVMMSSPQDHAMLSPMQQAVPPTPMSTSSTPQARHLVTPQAPTLRIQLAAETPRLWPEYAGGARGSSGSVEGTAPVVTPYGAASGTQLSGGDRRGCARGCSSDMELGGTTPLRIVSVGGGMGSAAREPGRVSLTGRAAILGGAGGGGEGGGAGRGPVHGLCEGAGEAVVPATPLTELMRRWGPRPQQPGGEEDGEEHGGSGVVPMTPATPSAPEGTTAAVDARRPGEPTEVVPGCWADHSRLGGGGWGVAVAGHHRQGGCDSGGGSGGSDGGGDDDGVGPSCEYCPATPLSVMRLTDGKVQVDASSIMRVACGLSGAQGDRGEHAACALAALAQADTDEEEEEWGEECLASQVEEQWGPAGRVAPHQGQGPVVDWAGEDVDAWLDGSQQQQQRSSPSRTRGTVGTLRQRYFFAGAAAGAFECMSEEEVEEEEGEQLEEKRSEALEVEDADIALRDGGEGAERAKEVQECGGEEAMGEKEGLKQQGGDDQGDMAAAGAASEYGCDVRGTTGQWQRWPWPASQHRQVVGYVVPQVAPPATLDGADWDTEWTAAALAAANASPQQQQGGGCDEVGPREGPGNDRSNGFALRQPPHNRQPLAPLQQTPQGYLARTCPQQYPPTCMQPILHHHHHQQQENVWPQPTEAQPPPLAPQWAPQPPVTVPASVRQHGATHMQQPQQPQHNQLCGLLLQPQGPLPPARQQQPPPPLGAYPPPQSSSSGPQLGEECNPAFWGGQCAPPIYEVFPFQRQALDFADWANLAPPAALTALTAALSAAAHTADRWRFMSDWMARHPPPPLLHPPPPHHPTPPDLQPPLPPQLRPPETAAAAPCEDSGQSSVAQHLHPHPEHPQPQPHQWGEVEQWGHQGAGGQPPRAGGAPQQPQQWGGVRGQRGPLEPFRVFVREYRRGRQGGGGRGGGGGVGGEGAPEYCRHFVVTTYRVMWRRYQQLASTQRHFYEVIRGDRPCHMYFDIEFSRGANPGADGEALVGAVVGLLGQVISAAWGLSQQPHHVLEMESVTSSEIAAAAAATKTAPVSTSSGNGDRAAQCTTEGSSEAVVAAGVGGGSGPLLPLLPDKFSRHLVVRLPGMALSGSTVAGALVAKMRPHFESSGLCLLKASEPPGGLTAPIVDAAVYSRHRHFRMLWCAKGGKDAVLRPTGRFMTAPADPAPLTHGATAGGAVSPPFSCQQLFLASLISNVHPGDRLLELPPGFMEGVQPVTSCRFLRGPSARPRADNGSCAASGTVSGAVYEGYVHPPALPATRPSIKVTWAPEPPGLALTRPQLPLPGGGSPGAGGAGAPTDPWGANGVLGGGGGGGGGDDGGGGCRLLMQLALAAVSFVEAMATDRAGGLEAQVRSMAYCGEGASVSYGMTGPGSHHCDRIGRPHRSNHVFFCCDFLRGMYCQKCYDVECAGWRSEWTAMPLETWAHTAPAAAPQPPPPPVHPNQRCPYEMAGGGALLPLLCFVTTPALPVPLVGQAAGVMLEPAAGAKYGNC